MSKQVNSKKEVSTAATTSSSNFYDSYVNGKELYYLLGLVVLAGFIIFQDFISLKKIYLFKDIGSDTINIYYPLLVNLSESMHNNGVPYWSFSQGMGQNIFPLWLGDFFSNFIMLFSKANLPKVIVFMELLKIILCSFIFFQYLKQLKLTGFACLLGALLYSFTGYVILGGTWIIFSTEAVYVAIILLGFERWLNQGKWFLFLLGIFLLSLLQPFYLYSYTIFLVFYIIVRYNEVRSFDWKEFIFFSLKTVGIAALGVAISAFQLLPDVLMLIESPRVGGEAGLSAKLKSQSMFGIADEVLRFTTTFRAFGNDMLGGGTDFKGWQNYLEAPILYCGILSLVAFPHVFGSLGKKEKKFYAILTVAFVLPILFPYFRYIFWAFSGDYYRTLSLVICVIMLFYSAKAISYIEQKQSINKIVLLVNGLFLLILLYTPKAEYKQAVNDGLRSFAAVLVLAYSFLLYLLSSKTAIKHTAKALLIAVCFIEILSFSYNTVNKRSALTKRELTEKVGYNDYTVDAVNFINKNDKSFFRINKDFSSGLAIHASINDGKSQSFYGTSSYHSFNQKNYIKFLGDLNVIDVKDENATRWAKSLTERPLLFSMASGKYWLSKRPDSYLQGFGYDSINKFGDVKVYKNRYALPFGFAYNKVMDLTKFKTLTTLQKDLYLLKGCVYDDEQSSDFTQFLKFDLKDTTQQFSFEEYGKLVSELRKDSVTITSFKDSHIEGTINLDSSKIVFFSIPFDEGWSATLNNAEVKLYRVNSGLTGMIVPKGNHKIALSFEPRLMKKGAMISVVGLIILLGLLLMNYFKKKSA